MKIDELAKLMGITRLEVKHILKTNDVIELNLSDYDNKVLEKEVF